MVDEVVFIDKVGLEDAIEFQQITFEILDGYFFESGRNNRIQEVISDLYNKRVELKNNETKGK